ncbi:MAG: archease [Candidatus Rokubacteria bacterium]|nr:archease [Candidatus Rokubacteria bacterium]
MSSAGFAYFDVEADVGVEAWGATLAEALGQVALGVLALSVGPEDVVDRETREVRAQGESAERLLVNWVNECLYVHEIEGFAACRVVASLPAPGIVHGVLHGEPIDRARHRLGATVKAATFHQVTVVEQPESARVRLVVDV